MAKRNVDENVFVKCPYYKCESQCVVYCEGVETNNCIHMAFATTAQRKAFEERFSDVYAFVYSSCCLPIR